MGVRGGFLQGVSPPIWGRPFGGVGFLWHKCLNRNIQVLKSDPYGRCLVTKLNIESKAILSFNMYLPCFESSADYRSELTFYLGFIEDILEFASHTDVVILGTRTFQLILIILVFH